MVGNHGVQTHTSELLQVQVASTVKVFLLHEVHDTKVAGLVLADKGAAGVQQP